MNTQIKWRTVVNVTNLLLCCLPLLWWLHWFHWFLRLQQGSGDVDLVLDAAVATTVLHSLTNGTDEIIFDPERFVQSVPRHRLAQILQHQAAVAVVLPLTLRQDDQTLRRFWRRLGRRTWRPGGGSQRQRISC